MAPVDPLRRGLSLALAAWPFAPAARAQPATAEAPLARTRQGRLAGVREAGGVLAFKGVPFAAPPLGPLRFRPPEPPPAWSGVRPAIRFAPAPIQPPGLVKATSEDCLYLNVWRPEAPGPHPVFVWIHGGGNIAGSASEITDGAAFARSGVVCVTIGYRLGAFGFLELGGALGPAFAGSGVNALRDQIAALRWVQDTIGEFGGDPGRVTLGGQSAGAKNVVALMASPLAQGLFASAIVESGGQTLHDRCSAEAVTDLLLRAAATQGVRAADLPILPAEALNRLQAGLLTAYDRPYPFRAVVGSDVLPTAPLARLEDGAFRGRRLLIGTNRDEAILFLKPASAGAPLAQHDLANISVEAARPIAAAYDRLFPGLDPLHRRVRLVTAEEYAAASFKIAQAVGAGSPTWMYRFEERLASGPFAGWTPHGTEVAYVWDAFDDPTVRMIYGDATPGERSLGQEVHARWCAFIRGEAPDAPGAPAWPPFDGRRVLLFADGRSAAAEADLQEWALWRDVPFAPPACARTGAG